MKKILSLVLAVLMVMNMCIVFADANYDNLIETAKEKSGIDMSLIDENSIVAAEYTEIFNMEKGIEPVFTFIYMKEKDTSDFHICYFEYGEYKATYKNFISFKPLNNFSKDKANDYAKQNNLSAPTDIKATVLLGRTQLFSYNIICNGISYIIPYHFTEESTFNIANDDTCKLEFGKAYTIDEFVEICKREEASYKEYQAEQEDKRDTTTYYVDKDGEVVELKPTVTEKEDTSSEPEQKEEVKATEEEKKEEVRQEEIKKEEVKEEPEQEPEKEENPTENKEELKENENAENEEIIQGASDWAIEEIKKAKEAGIAEKGKAYDYIKPITRAEFCELMYNLIDTLSLIPENATENFDDTDSKKIAALHTLGIIKGKSDTKFAPNDSLTREEAAVILNRTLAKAGANFATTQEYIVFDDENEISDWANGDIQVIYKLKIMMGVGEDKFAPKDIYTTEQAIATILRAYELLS